MSTYGNFIDEVLDSEYTLLKTLKDDESSKIQIYLHKATDNKLVKIQSANRNDHIFRALRGLKNDNLPVIFDVCSCDEYLIILESWIEGKTLAEIMEKEQISQKRCFKYIFDICKALDFLHKKSIIHRDVKPANIIITPEDKAVLIDFSAARLINEGQQKDTTNLGTVGYAAPEQFGLFQSLPPTDIYALGVLFNEMLINSHPSVKMPSGKLGKIIRKCTDTQISARYQTINSLVSDLKKYKSFRF